MEEQLTFGNRQEFRNWLNMNHDSCKGIWITFPTGKAGISVKADEALEEALCFGWIDGQIKKISPERYMKKFTPRRKGSTWSSRNRKIAGGLIRSGIYQLHEYVPIGETNLYRVLSRCKKGRYPIKTASKHHRTFE